jgi:hypothetical protein
VPGITEDAVQGGVITVVREAERQDVREGRPLFEVGTPQGLEARQLEDRLHSTTGELVAVADDECASTQRRGSEHEPSSGFTAPVAISEQQGSMPVKEFVVCVSSGFESVGSKQVALDDDRMQRVGLRPWTT